MASKVTTTKKKSPRSGIIPSSGNVFADLDFANSAQELLKAKLLLQIYKAIRHRNLTQAEAGEFLGIKQPHVSSLMRGQSGTFSVERLMDFLRTLGYDIEIAVTSSRRKQGELSVTLQ